MNWAEILNSHLLLRYALKRFLNFYPRNLKQHAIPRSFDPTFNHRTENDKIRLLNFFRQG